jgi:hypothetical protein
LTSIADFNWKSSILPGERGQFPPFSPLTAHVDKSIFQLLFLSIARLTQESSINTKHEAIIKSPSIVIPVFNEAVTIREIIARIQASPLPGLRIYEVGISYSGRSYGEGKKIKWKDGAKAVWMILKYQ